MCVCVCAVAVAAWAVQPDNLTARLSYVVRAPGFSGEPHTLMTYLYIYTARQTKVVSIKVKKLEVYQKFEKMRTEQLTRV